MWAPADLFTPATNVVVLSLKRVVTYFAEHLLVLLLAIVAVAALIAVTGSLANRRKGGS